ncbi:hypothetical protein DRO69_10130 [Candidatus Bathyarchaeota archaeon]|nr:MAG: hypothetical protein DRO69_10130 [Candidatus Bathyarchaeota archaeon]
MIRGIQIVGLLLAFAAIAFVLYARRKGRINGRSFLFWVLFWILFIVFDLYPSIVAYVAPVLTLESNMYILTAGSTLTLFVLVFVLYTFLSDLKHKITTMIREQAIIDYKVAKMLEAMNDDRKEDRNSNSGS